MSIFLKGFVPLIHCSSAGFQPPQSSSWFTHFCSINKHTRALKWNNVPCRKGKKQPKQHNLLSPWEEKKKPKQPTQENPVLFQEIFFLFTEMYLIHRLSSGGCVGPGQFIHSSCLRYTTPFSPRSFLSSLSSYVAVSHIESN